MNERQKNIILAALALLGDAMHKGLDEQEDAWQGLGVGSGPLPTTAEIKAAYQIVDSLETR